MENNWYIEQFRRKINEVIYDKGSSIRHIDELTKYMGERITSDSAQYHAMKSRERGESTLEIIEAAFYGAFGVKPSKEYSDSLSSESQTEN